MLQFSTDASWARFELKVRGFRTRLRHGVHLTCYIGAAEPGRLGEKTFFLFPWRLGKQDGAISPFGLDNLRLSAISSMK